VANLPLPERPSSESPDLTAQFAGQLEKAIEIAVNAHCGQRDKSGAAYILHVLRVLLDSNDPIAMQAAVLHDVVEDTNVKPSDLIQAGIHPEAIHAIDLLTRQTQNSDPLQYADYIVRIKSNAVAKSVKLSDLRDNYRLDRVALRSDQTDEDVERIQKYVLSYQFLTDQIDLQEYHNRMSNLS